MSLQMIILNSLLDGESTGYDIMTSFKDLEGMYWVAKHQQIYRELGHLEVAGKVVSTAIPQTGKPDKRVYSITPLGIKALDEMVVTACKPDVIRNTLCAKVISSTEETSPALIKELLSVIDVSTGHINHALKMEEKIKVTKMLHPTTKKKQLAVVSYNKTYWNNLRSWCKETIKMLDSCFDITL